MPTPDGRIVHQTDERVRIKIPSMQGNVEFFSSLKQAFQSDGPVSTVEVNPGTGSVLFVGKSLSIDAVSEWGEKAAFFQLETESAAPVPLSRKIAAPFRELSRSVNRFSGGEIDLAGVAFLTLLGVGVVQLTRGNLAAPPWYVAFWYALGIFSRSLIDKE